MMHRAWSSIVEVPYYFSRSYVKFQGHTALKIVEFYPNWAFPDCNSSLNSPMAMKCCTKLETAKERCPIFFQGHPSNFKVTQYKTSPILTQIGRFRTIGQSQLSNPSDLPCLFQHTIVVFVLSDYFVNICTIWCYPHRMGHRQHTNLKMDLVIISKCYCIICIIYIYSLVTLYSVLLISPVILLQATHKRHP